MEKVAFHRGYCTSCEKTLRCSAVGETSVTAESAAPASQDGRVSRAARTRLAVVDALLTLHEQGSLRPTARDIAAEAGVSLRSLYVHFDDLEALFIAASERYTEKLAAVLDPPLGEGTFAERLDSFLDRRAVIHEFGAGVRRAALLQEPFSPVLQGALNNGRKALRADVRYCFAPEIAAAGPEGGRRLTSALDIVAGAPAWDALRGHQGLSVDEAAARVRDMVLAFIAAWVPETAGPGPDPSEPDTTAPTAAGPQG
jgi:TetR/AcrR family transcriptional regulator, regulator of autoinduction and epiphytic fitness